MKKASKADSYIQAPTFANTIVRIHLYMYICLASQMTVIKFVLKNKKKDQKFHLKCQSGETPSASALRTSFCFCCLLILYTCRWSGLPLLCLLISHLYLRRDKFRLSPPGSETITRSRSGGAPRVNLNPDKPMFADFFFIFPLWLLARLTPYHTCFTSRKSRDPCLKYKLELRLS